MNQNKIMRNKIYNLDDEFDFGRNKGKTIKELLQVNPGYVDWVIRNIEGFALSNEAFQQAKIITEGKRFSKKEIVELSNEKQNLPILFRKLYGWDYDFSKEDILLINNLKINEINSKTKNTYSVHSYHDDTDWSNYNDDIDMDQQSEEFWNQF